MISVAAFLGGMQWGHIVVSICFLLANDVLFHNMAILLQVQLAYPHLKLKRIYIRFHMSSFPQDITAGSRAGSQPFVGITCRSWVMGVPLGQLLFSVLESNLLHYCLLSITTHHSACSAVGPPVVKELGCFLHLSHYQYRETHRGSRGPAVSQNMERRLQWTLAYPPLVLPLIFTALACDMSAHPPVPLAVQQAFFFDAFWRDLEMSVPHIFCGKRKYFCDVAYVN